MILETSIDWQNLLLVTGTFICVKKFFYYLSLNGAYVKYTI